MKQYLFSDNQTGKEFLIEANNLADAKKQAKEYSAEPYCINILTKEDAKAIKFYMKY